MKLKETVGHTLLALLSLATLALVVWWGVYCVHLAKNWLTTSNEPPHIREESR